MWCLYMVYLLDLTSGSNHKRQVIGWPVNMCVHLLLQHYNSRLALTGFCFYSWSHEKRSGTSLLWNSSAGVLHLTFPQMCNMLMTPHHAANSRTLIEYSVHIHTHCVSRDCQMAVTMETSYDVYSARVQPTFTLARPATCWTCMSLWCVSFSIVLILQSSTDMKYFIVWEWGNIKLLESTRQKWGRERHSQIPRGGDKGKVKRQERLTHHWTLLSSSLVWIHLTDQSPERKKRDIKCQKVVTKICVTDSKWKKYSFHFQLIIMNNACFLFRCQPPVELLFVIDNKNLSTWYDPVFQHIKFNLLRIKQARKPCIVIPVQYQGW